MIAPEAATPERLISKRGRAIATEALAGSIASGDEHREMLLKSGKDRRSLLRFDLSSIPGGAAVTSATLRLFVTVEHSAVTVNLHRATRGWVEGTGDSSSGADWDHADDPVETRYRVARDEHPEHQRTELAVATFALEPTGLEVEGQAQQGVLLGVHFFAAFIIMFKAF